MEPEKWLEMFEAVASTTASSLPAGRARFAATGAAGLLRAVSVAVTDRGIEATIRLLEGGSTKRASRSVLDDPEVAEALKSKPE